MSKQSPAARILAAASAEPEPLAITYTLADAAKVSGLSRRTLYNLHARGELPFVKIGTRTLIRRADLEQLLEGGAA